MSLLLIIFASVPDDTTPESDVIMNMEFGKPSCLSVNLNEFYVVLCKPQGIEHCRERQPMTNIVANLQRGVLICDDKDEKSPILLLTWEEQCRYATTFFEIPMMVIKERKGGGGNVVVSLLSNTSRSVDKSAKEVRADENVNGKLDREKRVNIQVILRC
nr:kinesin-like protein KIN-5D [Tanacetum cinerariifolium]